VVEEIENNNNTEPDPEPKNLQDSTPSFSVVDYDQNNPDTNKKKKKTKPVSLSHKPKKEKKDKETDDKDPKRKSKLIDFGKKSSKTSQLMPNQDYESAVETFIQNPLNFAYAKSLKELMEKDNNFQNYLQTLDTKKITDLILLLAHFVQ